MSPLPALLFLAAAAAAAAAAADSATCESEDDCRALGTLATVLAPASLAEFAAQHWQRAPLVHAGRGGDVYGSLLPLEALDELIARGVALSEDSQQPEPGMRNDRDYKIVRSVKDDAGVRRAQKHVGTERLTVAAAHDAVAHGFSLVINAAQRRWPNVAALALAMERALGLPVYANLYLTPAGAQGFTAHFDAQEVFIAQLAGAKRWFVHGAPVPLARPQDVFEVEDAGLPADSFVLAPGDFLYLPRGVVHQAVALDRGDVSLHLTFGIEPAEGDLWQGMLKRAAGPDAHAAVDARAAADVALRRFVPLAPLLAAAEPPRDETLRALLRSCAASSNTAAAAALAAAAEREDFGELWAEVEAESARQAAERRMATLRDLERAGFNVTTL